MRNVRLNLEYDGTDFQGWQMQPEARTVQGTLEAAIQTVCRHPVDVFGCARTDAGVHALGYVASFRTESDIPAARLTLSLNAVLPPDVAVLAEPLAVSEKGMNEAHLLTRSRLGEDAWSESAPPRVLVTGMGPIGFTAVLAAIARGWPATMIGRQP